MILFDRDTGVVEAPDFKSRFHTMLMQITHRMLAPIGYTGISRVHGALNALLRPTTRTLIKEGGWQFQYPSRDYYWNRLLDSRYHYEPEIDRTLLNFAEVPFVFLDLGANFGFWSAKVSSEVYGHHRCVAVEASNYCLDVLKDNLAGSQVSIHHRAIDTQSGNTLKLYGGDRHAGQSIDPSWSGATKSAVNDVVTLSLDDLMDLENIDPNEVPTLVKLDVEGVELRALKGAAKLAAGRSLWLIEDCGTNSIGEATKYARDELGMTLYLDDGKSIVELTGWDQLIAYKSRLPKFQAVGVNILATSSDFWLDQMTRIRS